MGDPVEVELKYRVLDQAGLERLLDTEWLADHATGPWRTIELEDRYLDTRDERIAAGGFAARLRREGEAIELTLKSRSEGEGPSGALFRRIELEGPADDGLDAAAWPDSDARARLLELTGGAALQERFRLRQVRRERELRGSDGWALLSLDEVRVDAAGSDLGGGTFLELEARGGAERLLQEVGALLEASGAVTPEGRSKEALARELIAAQRKPPAVRPWAPDLATQVAPERGSGNGHPAEELPLSGLHSEDPVEGLEDALETEPTSVAIAVGDAPGPDAPVTEIVGGEPAPPQAPASTEAIEAAPPSPTAPATAEPAPARSTAQRLAHRLDIGKTPGIVAQDALSEAGRKVLRFNFARMLLREGGTREGSDPEELHAMRVATRRMRAAWRVFGDAYRPGKRRHYVGELRSVAGALGAVRDRDVLIDALRTYRDALTPGEAAAIEPLLDAWASARDAARVELLALLDSPRYREFVHDYFSFVETVGSGAATVPATQPHRVRETAPSRVWAAYEQLRAYDATLTWADVPTLHELRISGKRLRYTLEFFREVLGPDTPQLIVRVTTLQDHLGALHDADVAAHLAREFLAGSAAGLAPVSIEAVGRYLASREREVARLRRTLPATWRPLVNESFRRALGRAVSVL
ncbi:MAG: CYTH and CHAD domain-containing protein [Candidatus Limnocylindrales bacterium]